MRKTLQNQTTVEKYTAKTDNCREKHCKNRSLWKKHTETIDN